MINRAEVDAKAKAVEVQGQVLVRNLSKACEQAMKTPLPIMAGVVPRGVNGVAVSAAPDDAIFVEKTKGTLFGPALRLKNENIFAFCARTELSLHEIRTLPRQELIRRIQLRAESREREYVYEPKRPAKLIPDHLRVTFAAEGNLDAHLGNTKLPPNMIDTADLDSLWDRVNAAQQG